MKWEQIRPTEVSRRYIYSFAAWSSRPRGGDVKYGCICWGSSPSPRFVPIQPPRGLRLYRLERGFTPFSHHID